MSRRILAASFAMAFVPLIAGAPAHAKGPDSATVAGPGIDTTTITWNRPDRASLGPHRGDLLVGHGELIGLDERPAAR
jgi:hypothetical protein